MVGRDERVRRRRSRCKVVAITLAGLVAMGAATRSPTVARTGTRSPRPTPTPSTAPTPRPSPSPVVSIDDYETLAKRKLIMPVAGVDVRRLTSNFGDARGRRGHGALDIVAASGTPVVAVDDGVIAKLFTSVPGGLTIYQFDAAGSYAYYYAHLARYADGLGEGAAVKRGAVIGYVGQTGNARSPHLHFAIDKLGPERIWWKGTPLDPYPVLLHRLPLPVPSPSPSNGAAAKR